MFVRLSYRAWLWGFLQECGHPFLTGSIWKAGAAGMRASLCVVDGVSRTSHIVFERKQQQAVFISLGRTESTQEAEI